MDGFKIMSAHGTRDISNPDDLFILRSEVADTSRRIKRRFEKFRESGRTTGGMRRSVSPRAWVTSTMVVPRSRATERRGRVRTTSSSIFSNERGRGSWSCPSPALNASLRFATEDLEIGGTRITRGDSVTLSVGAANRDPDRLVPGRDTTGTIAFGHGIHRCLDAADQIDGGTRVDDEFAVPVPEGWRSWTRGAGCRRSTGSFRSRAGRYTSRPQPISLTTWCEARRGRCGVQALAVSGLGVAAKVAVGQIVLVSAAPTAMGRTVAISDVPNTGSNVASRSPFLALEAFAA